ncbi:unnamed protein product [Effrenium voratum]|nr:unnamed protein product [Effrenium voratum]
MSCAHWAYILSLAISALAERIHVVPEEFQELTSCEAVGEYQVSKEGLELDTCTFAKGILKVHLLGPLTVRGNATVLGNITFLGRGTRKAVSFPQACVTIGGTLSVFGSLVIGNCFNNGFGDKAHGGCLNANDLVMEEGLVHLENCTTAGRGGGNGGGASLGTLHQRGGAMSFSDCLAVDGGGLNASSVVVEGGSLNFEWGMAERRGGCAHVHTLHQRGGEVSFIHCGAERGHGGGLAARIVTQDHGAMRFGDSWSHSAGGCAHAEIITTSGTLSFEKCRSSGGGGCGYAERLTQSESGRLTCRECEAEEGGCLLVWNTVDARGVWKASSVAAKWGSVLLMAQNRPLWEKLVENPSCKVQRLEVEQASGVALIMHSLTVEELILGPSDQPFQIQANNLSVPSPNCSSLEDCLFEQRLAVARSAISTIQRRSLMSAEERKVWQGWVRPLCRRGSGLVDVANENTTHAQATRMRGCRRCSAGLAQVQQGVWAPCACPQGWTCQPETMQMPQGMMPLNLSNPGWLAKCLSSSACPGGQLPEDSKKPWCAPGHLGPLCAVCTDRFYHANDGCEKCAEASDQDQRSLWAVAAVLGIAGVLAAVAAWLLREAAVGRWNKAVVLLQLAQLYAVLGTSMQGSREWERTYMDFTQLTLAQVKDAVRAECQWHGPSVRLASALASPVAPVVLLLACSTLELLKPSLGDLFYIGGARQSSDLFRCQRVDAGGDPLGDYAFLQKLPSISCSDNSGMARWVHATGCGTALFYVVIIPAALLYLFVRQHVVLKPSKTVTAVAEKSKAGWLVRLQPLREIEGEHPQDVEHLLAAAVAHMAVALHGEVRLQLLNGKAEMRTADVSGFLETDDSTTQTLRSRAIMEMLVERCEMERVSTQDRLLAGAKEVFFKYALCRCVWMEFVQKLLAVGLLAVMSTDDALNLALAMILGMAATIAMVRPYIQPQMNDLHCISMICLAGAAIGFSNAGTSGDFDNWLWLSRVSFLLPLLLAAMQVLRPDSCEALATRLFQEARQKLPELKEEKEVELFVDLVSF